MRYDLARVFPISQCVWRYAEIVGSVGDPQIVAELVHRRRLPSSKTYCYLVKPYQTLVGGLNQSIGCASVEAAGCERPLGDVICVGSREQTERQADAWPEQGGVKRNKVAIDSIRGRSWKHSEPRLIGHGRPPRRYLAGVETRARTQPVRQCS